MNTNTHHSTFMIRTIIICILILNNNNHTTPITLMTPGSTQILESSIGTDIYTSIVKTLQNNKGNITINTTTTGVKLQLSSLIREA